MFKIVRRVLMIATVAAASCCTVVVHRIDVGRAAPPVPVHRLDYAAACRYLARAPASGYAPSPSVSSLRYVLAHVRPAGRTDGFLTAVVRGLRSDLTHRRDVRGDVGVLNGYCAGRDVPLPSYYKHGPVA